MALKKEDQSLDFWCNTLLDVVTQTEVDHGRIETRECRILDVSTIADKEVPARWPGLKTIVEVKSTVGYADDVAETIRHYINVRASLTRRISICWNEGIGLLRTNCIGILS